MITDDPTTGRATLLRSRLHSQCILCGAEHQQGLRLAFNTHADGHVEATFPCDRLYQGYTGFRMEADLRQNGKSMARATAKFMETQATDIRMIEA